MVSKALRPLIRAGRKSPLAWRYLFNLGPTVAYRSGRRALTGEAGRVLADLNRDGVAITSAEALFEGDSPYAELAAAVEALERRLSGEIERARAEANDPAIGRKTFIHHLLGEKPALDPQHICTRFALHNPVLQIANGYFGMYTQLRYYNVWHTLATRGEARESQLWHRDREDYHILKVFVYFSDVDEGAGPFIYAPGTHLKGKLRQDPDSYLEGGVKRSEDQQMAAVVPPERWVTCTGRKGTIVFADTRGYHKGGLARERDRIMYACMFTSSASEVREHFVRPERLPAGMAPEQAFALAAPGRKRG
jgi:hypothetical protein